MRTNITLCLFVIPFFLLSCSPNTSDPNLSSASAQQNRDPHGSETTDPIAQVMEKHEHSEPETPAQNIKPFQPDPEAFIVSFDLTSHARTVQIDTTSLPIHLKEEDRYGDYSLDCDGDGIFEQTHLNGNATCIYEHPGHYHIQIKGVIPRIFLSSISDTIDVEQWGNIQWKTMAFMGSNCTHLTISAKDAPDLSHVTSMAGMFWDATYFNSPIEHWDVSHVTDMRNLFFLVQSFNQPLNAWDVSHVEDMERMFYGASAFNSPIDRWNVSKVKSFREMFSNATAFNQSLQTWRPRKANMRRMFYHAESFNQDLSHWNFKDKQLVGFFIGASSFEHQPTLDKIQADIKHSRVFCCMDRLFINMD